jgi:hypothetical protein
MDYNHSAFRILSGRPIAFPPTRLAQVGSFGSLERFSISIIYISVSTPPEHRMQVLANLKA